MSVGSIAPYSRLPPLQQSGVANAVSGFTLPSSTTSTSTAPAAGASASASADPFQQLSSEIQSLLTQMQGNQAAPAGQAEPHHHHRDGGGRPANAANAAPISDAAASQAIVGDATQVLQAYASSR